MTELQELPARNGQWKTLDLTMGINPVHLAIVHTRKALIIAGSGNNPNTRIFKAAVWDLEAGTIRTFTYNLDWDMFCNGMVILSDGCPFILGGTLRYGDAHNHPGEPRTAVFDPITEKFVNRPTMSGGRWYPTATVLGDGSVLVYSGNGTDGHINRTVQRWIGGAWIDAGTAFDGVPLYPRQHLLPDGTLFVSGEKRVSQFYDPASRTFTRGPATGYDQVRHAGTAGMLPLRPADGFNPTVMILGGGPVGGMATETTELIDLSVPQPRWGPGPSMSRPRKHLNATILPDGKILVSGGFENPTTSVKQAQIYDPRSGERGDFSFAGTMRSQRGYHSVAVLLPNAKVVALGDDPDNAGFGKTIEEYSPAYLFNADGSLASRPTITSVAPENIGYGATFEVRTNDALNITSVVLIRSGAVTHSFDMEQRLVELRFTTAPGVLTAQAPEHGNYAPPGYYMIFIVDGQGVPSVARFVRLVAPVALTAVGASSSLDNAPPSAAVDGNPNTSWNSGGFPPASIDLDLGATHAVTRVRLRVNQYPDGNTTHEIYGGPSLSSLALLRTLSGYTTAFTWLDTRFSPAAGNVRFLRVRTTVSPSWVSWFWIQAYGTPD